MNTKQSTYQQKRDDAAAPITSAEDPRYAELMKFNPSIDWLSRPEQAGENYRDLFFESAEFKGTKPAWASYKDSDVNNSIDDEGNPVAFWGRVAMNLPSFQAEIIRTDTYMVDEDRVIEGNTEIGIGIGRNDTIKFPSVAEMREAAGHLLAAADMVESRIR
jgi:hypothetical protein